MGKYKVKIFVACGSGVVTSTLAVDAVKRIAKEIEIPVEIRKGTFMELSTLDDTYELVLTTANYRKPIKQRHMSVFGLLTRINEEKTKEELKNMLRDLYTGQS